MSIRRRFFLTALFVPTLTTAVGIDGGAVFQIAASESLGLDSRAVGIAFGLGVLSIPMQLWAARMPLWRARRNLQVFLGITSVLCAALAVLLAMARPGDRLAVGALVVTVVAEINLSVLYATSWQPLVSFALTPQDRQRLNSRGNAAAGLLKALAALVFGALVLSGRIAFYAVAAAAAVALAFTLRRLPVPDRPAARATTSARVPASMKPLYVAVGIVAAGAWPLFVTYVDDVLWPTVNLGLIAAVQVTGSLLAAALWRATTADVTARARLAAGISAAATVAVAALRVPVDTAAEEAVVFVSLATAAAATTVVMISLMELAHRAIDAQTSVRSMTIYDVVASSSMQAGLLVAGFLVAASEASEGATGPDAYRVYLVAMAAVTLVVLSRLRRSNHGRPRPGRPPTGRLADGAQ